MRCAAKNDSIYLVPNFIQNTIRYTIYYPSGEEAWTVRSLATAKKRAGYIKGFYKKWDVNNL